MSGWITTFSGQRIKSTAVHSTQIDREDCTRGLAMQVRFLGQVRGFYCPAPEELVLTEDLRWVPAGDLRQYDALLGFDEHPVKENATGSIRRRHLCPSVVTASVPVKRKIIRLEMSDGSTVRASSEHPWLCATKLSRNQTWLSAGSLYDDVKRGRKRYMHKFITPWRIESSRASGWLAGIYDGEGCLSTVNRGMSLSVAQKPGEVLTEIRTQLDKLKLQYRLYQHKSGVCQIYLSGGWRVIAQFLGQIRPIRLLSKWKQDVIQGSIKKRMSGEEIPLQIVKAWDEGFGECAGLETSSRTYICGGYGAHNSVAEHSILVADIAAFYGASKLAQQCALLHDGHEYITGDFPTPYKDDVEGLRPWERNIEIIFRASLGLPPNIDPVWTEIKRCDLVALHYEAHNLMGPNPGWIDEDLVAKVWPSWAPIRCLDWKEAASAFSAKASVLGLSGF